MLPKRLAILVAGALMLCGCFEPEDSRTAAARSYIREVTGEDLKKSPCLQVATTDVSTDGRFAKIRGLVTNNFGETVHGVRYLVTIYEAGSPPRVLDRWQEEVDATIEPGQRSLMRLDVESGYFGSLGRRPIDIDAQPVTVGDTPMPPPAGWR